MISKMYHRKIAIMTAGGDCPGMNAAIRAIVVKAIEYGFEVAGIKRGWRGLLNEELEDLDINSISNILHLGGTVLGTSRFNPIKEQGGEKKILANIEKNKINAIIVIGGRDSLDVATKIAKLGVNIIGIPKTINNDIAYTDYCIGFDSAKSIVCDSIDKLSTTAFSHHRVMIIETMGKETGWLALTGGLAGGADWILIPEIKTDLEKLTDQLYKRRFVGKTFSIIVVAEGVILPGIKKEKLESRDEFGRPRYDLRNAGKALGRYIEKLTNFETRVTVLGYLQRGGIPTAYDRIKSTHLGIAAVEAIKDRISNIMLAFQGNQICRVDLEDALLNSPKMVDLELYEEARLFYDI